MAAVGYPACMLLLLVACTGEYVPFPVDTDPPTVSDSAIVDTAPPPEEICDGVDNDGDGEVDESFDEDGDGFTSCNGDCDDTDPFIAPGMPDVCDGVDNDCSGAIDEPFDDDGDGDSACGLDCDDQDPSISGHLPEICDGQDNDCDEQIDEGFDEDGDGFTTCRGDCDDSNAATYPGAEEICDGQVNTCKDETLDETVDNDGDGYSICQGDCNDTEPAAFAGAEEICDGIDNDCNTAVDEFPECFGCVTSGDHLWCTSAVPWASAQQACDTLGAHLVSIADATENSTVASVAGGNSAWIGFHDLDEEGTFVWEDGSLVTYTNWNSGEPNDAGGEDCTQINYGTTGGWNDFPCSASQPFVCEW